MNKFLALTTVALLVSVPAAFAGHHEGGEGHGKGEKMMERMFEKGDTDGDGVISKAEFMASAEERFAKMDGDGDGNVTKEEAKAAHEKMREKWKEMKDKKAEKAEDVTPPADDAPKAAE